MILIYSDDQLLNLAFPPPYQELFELFGSQLQSSTENVFAPYLVSRTTSYATMAMPSLHVGLM